jgi:hypothetical protein
MKIKGQGNNFIEEFKILIPKVQIQRIKFIELIVKALVDCLDLNYVKLACKMNTKAKNSSNYRRIQRFVAQFSIGQSVLAKWILQKISPDEDSRVVLSMDRTNWKFGKSNINYLVLAVCYKGMAIPIFWTLFTKRGNSATEERKTLIKKFIEAFGAHRIGYILGDREFIGQEWQAWLIEEELPFYFRVRNDAKVTIKGKEIKASNLFKKLSVGEILHKNNLVIVYGTEVYLSGKKILDKDGKTDYVIIISYFEPRKCFEKYKMRWEIEHMFKALKSSGFNMESTHVTDKNRLETLLELITIAFVWAYLTGEWLVKKGKHKVRIKKHGRPEKSIFRVGLEYLCRIISTDYKVHFNNPFHVLSCT